MTAPSTPVRLPAPGGIQLTVKMTQNGQNTACVLGALGPKTAAAGQAWLAHFWSTFRVLLPSTVVCTGGVVRDVGQVDGVSFELAAPSSPAGAYTGTPSIAASSMLIRWRTETGGRSGRGRTFLPGVPTNWIADDTRTIKASDLATIQTAVNAYVSGFSSGDVQPLEPAVLSFTKGAAYPVVQGTAVALIGVQRRRMRA